MAQGRWASLGVQAGVAFGSPEFGGAGTSISGDLGVHRALRVSAQWTDWQALAGCFVSHGYSECSTDAHFVELGLRQGFGLGERVAPFVGVGVGIQHRRDQVDGQTTNNPFLSLSSGLDLALRPPLTLRSSLLYQEVLSGTLADRYGGRVRFVGLLLGLGLATW